MKKINFKVNGTSFGVGFRDDEAAQALFNSITTTNPDGVEAINMKNLSEAEAEIIESNTSNIEVKSQSIEELRAEKLGLQSKLAELQMKRTKLKGKVMDVIGGRPTLIEAGIQTKNVNTDDVQLF